MNVKGRLKKLQHLIKGGRGTETIWKKNRIYIGEYIKYTELEGFEDYYEERGVEMK